MFEDATFESMGRIHTRSRNWMLATSTINGTILTALILFPLVHPPALPHQALTYLLQVPEMPAPPQPPPVRQMVQRFHGIPESAGRYIFAPSRIPRDITMLGRPEQPPGTNLNGIDTGPGMPDGIDKIFHGHNAVPVVRANRGPVRVSSMVVAGLLIRKTIPPYPIIARVARIEGTVVLQATISTTGTIENLRAVSGPPMLQQAALDAVQTWRYRPYLLNGQPVEVETTVNVVFRLGR